MIDYSEDLLPLSGLQHFAFCRRQWALIHLEQQWQENLRTVEGGLLHRRAHEGAARERRSDTLILRGLQVVSHQLGLSGQCDVVEFHAAPKGVPLQGEEGLWQPYPVEYKRGKPKSHQADELQLCAQAMCLEEMLCCDIPEGALFYGEPRRREPVAFTEELRQEGSRVRVSALCPGHVETNFDARAKVRRSIGGVSAKRGAQAGIEGLLRGKVVVLPGALMKMTYVGEKLLPESWMLKIAYRAQARKG